MPFSPSTYHFRIKFGGVISYITLIQTTFEFW